MGKTYLANAFSLQMIESSSYAISVNEIEKPSNLSELVSHIGHEDCAKFLGVKFNRVTTRLRKEDMLVVAQLQGGRLPEGCTTLPDNFVFKFFEIKIL